MPVGLQLARGIAGNLVEQGLELDFSSSALHSFEFQCTERDAGLVEVALEELAPPG